MGILADYKAPEKVNPYAADVAELVKLGIGTGYEIVAPTEQTEEGKRGRTIAGEKAKFQDAVRAAGHSARITEREDREDGLTRLVFVLGAKRERTAPAEAKKDK